MNDLLPEDDFFIADAAPDAAKATKMKKSTFARIVAAAACLVLIFGTGAWTYAAAVEYRDYRTAVEFFNENGLSSEGLTRSEIKAVWRDITTNSFNYSKTAEVIKNIIPGQKLTIDDTTSDDTEKDRAKETISFGHTVKYGNNEYTYQTVCTKPGGVFEKCVVNKKTDGKTVWQHDIKYIEPHGIAAVGTNIVVYGVSPTDYAKALFSVIDENGNEAVSGKYLNSFGFGDEYICSVVDNGDGSFAVISRGDLKHLCMTQFDAKAEKLSCVSTEIGNYGLTDAARLGNWYIVKAINYNRNIEKFLKLDAKGNVTGEFTLDSDNSFYRITDILGFGSSVYMSGYAVSKPTDGSKFGGRTEIDPVLEHLYSMPNRGVGITSEELTPIVRAQYTAILFKCDTDSGAPQEFYSADGSLGGDLSIDANGNLVWSVESIASTRYSLTTSSYKIAGTCNVYNYTFDRSGTLVSHAKTDKQTVYRR